MNGYVDFHSGVLPRMDAENLEAEVEKSVEILKILHKAKIKTVVATPYFNSVDDNVPSFLAKREEAYKLLSEKIKGLSLPRVILGSEVLFTTSLLDTKGVNKLCVGDTNYIMLALPYQEYSEMVLETLQKIIISRNLFSFFYCFCITTQYTHFGFFFKIHRSIFLWNKKIGSLYRLQMLIQQN